jgi:hypothetical protein
VVICVSALLRTKEEIMSMQRSRLWGLLGLSVAVVLLVVLPRALLQADDGDKGKYGQLTATWWQWVLGQPAVDVDGTNTNPVLDSTAAYATVGQENGIGPGNKYFFLTGTFGGSATRTVTIPSGKTLFFPLINTEVDNASEPPTDYKVPELRDIATANIDGTVIASLVARLDGADVSYFRKASPVFSYTLPDQNSLYAYFGLFGPQFEGTIDPAVSDGYWAVIPPLSKGSHVVELAGAYSNGFSVSATYNLTVN